MKIYRIENVKHEGLWNGNIRFYYGDLCKENEEKMLLLGRALHPPKSNEIISYVDASIPRTGRYFFKEEMYLRWKDILEDITKRIAGAILVVIDLDELTEYMVLYEDENQIFITTNWEEIDND